MNMTAIPQSVIEIVDVLAAMPGTVGSRAVRSDDNRE